MHQPAKKVFSLLFLTRVQDAASGHAQYFPLLFQASPELIWIWTLQQKRREEIQSDTDTVQGAMETRCCHSRCAIRRRNKIAQLRKASSAETNGRKKACAWRDERKKEGKQAEEKRSITTVHGSEREKGITVSVAIIIVKIIVQGAAATRGQGSTVGIGYYDYLGTRHKNSH